MLLIFMKMIAIVNRALSLIASSKSPASSSRPVYNPIGTNFLVIYLHRDRKILYEQINKRTEIMMDQGWIEEVERLQSTVWEPFLKQKKLIGYPEIFAYLEGQVDKDTMITTIAKKTRNYAKRQETFWRMFKKLLQQQNAHESLAECNLSDKTEINLLRKLIKIRGAREN